MGGRLGEQRGENEEKKFQNFINKRETRHSFAGGDVIEVSEKNKPSLILSEGRQL